MTALNIQFCLENGICTQADVERLLAQVVRRDGLVLLAMEFDTDAHQMAVYALDAGIACMRACLIGATAQMLSPAPIADHGWDVLADNPDEADYYRGFCQRLSMAMGVQPVVIEHVKLTPARQVVARDTGAVDRVVQIMQDNGIPFVTEHWPLAGHPGCAGSTVIIESCEMHLAPA